MRDEGMEVVEKVVYRWRVFDTWKVVARSTT